MTQTAEPTSTAYAYQAQTAEGQPISGTIDAADAQQATHLLQQLRLRVLQLEPVQRAVRPRALRGDDFLAFNQQLTHLTRAGLPVEQGLKLIAQDMRSRRLGQTVRQVAEELDRGEPLDRAFEKHADKFPPLYGRLVAAGVSSNNLAGMLLNLGRHLELVYRLRAALWRALAYPLMVLAGLALVLIFLGLFVIPQFEVMFRDFGIKLPWATLVLLEMARYVYAFIIAAVVVVVGAPLLWLALRATRTDRAVIDYLVLPLPLIGPVLKRNMVARWCDAVRLGAQAGLDLPRAIGLADDAIGSPRLRRDGQLIVAMLESGQAIESVVGRTAILPATVPAAMGMAQKDLPETLATLGEMYQQQAELRLGMIPALLTPLLIVLVAGVIGFVVAALFMPLIALIAGMSG
jgi:type IV pilus assembly protein PilC